MLTDPLLLELVQEKKLTQWTPGKGVVVRKARYLLLEPDLHAAINLDPWPRDGGELPREAALRRRQMHAFLAKYINGDGFWPDQHIKALDPTEGPEFKGLIEFRSMPPDPQSRLFCVSFAPSVLIGLHFGLREDLGNKGDPRWSVAAAAAKVRWNKLFGNRAPGPVSYPLNTRAKLLQVLNG